jgi:hypothetical protein
MLTKYICKTADDVPVGKLLGKNMKEFTSLKSLNTGVGSGVGFGSGSISQRYGSGSGSAPKCHGSGNFVKVIC